MDIQNGAAYYLYDSPYHGEYPSGRQIWFSEDGSRIFSSSKTIFKASDSKSTDLLYNGSISVDNISNLDHYSYIKWLDHSLVKAKIYIIHANRIWTENNRTSLPYIYRYNSDNLLLEETYSLEKYMAKTSLNEGNIYDAEPNFVFSNSNGDMLYILTKALTESDILHKWALQKIKVE